MRLYLPNFGASRPQSLLSAGRPTEQGPVGGTMLRLSGAAPQETH